MRYYLLLIGLLLTVSMQAYYSISPYAWCGNNPVRYLDLIGKSTHINENGNVVAVYADNDLNIYQHSNDKLEEWGDVYINPLTIENCKES